MALRACHECGKEVSSAAAACPHCGAKPDTGISFVTFIKWGVAIAFGVLVFSCVTFMSAPWKSPGDTTTRTATSTTPTFTAERCEPSRIDVDKIKGRVEGDYVYVTGKLKNNCLIATGIQIKVTIYDAAGGVLSSNDTWPASTNNIPTGADFPFETMERRRPGFKSVDVRVIAVYQWKQR